MDAAHRRMERTLRSLKEGGFWPLKVNVDQYDESDPEIIVPDGRSVQLCQDGSFGLLTAVGDKFNLEYVPTIKSLLKLLRGNLKKDYIKTHRADGDRPLCGNLPGHYVTKPVLSEAWSDVTCQKCLKRRESVDVPKTDQNAKQNPHGLVPRPAVSGVLPHTK